MKKADWVWMPHAGHLIVGNDYRFHLAACVGNWLVSTVGEYWPDSSVRELLAESRKVVLKGMGDARANDYMKKIGFEEIGAGRKYETMVFAAKKSDTCRCCPFDPKSWSEVDAEGYDDPVKAYEGHLKMCEKWAEKAATL